jgi:ABC-type multidrug transport system fused ATPase/permease subunit
VFRSVLKLLESRHRWSLAFLVFGILSTSVLNIGGVASIMPFIQLLAAPETAEANAFLRTVFAWFNLAPDQTTIIALGFLVLGLFVLGNGMLALVTWRSIRFSRLVAYDLSGRLFRTYIGQEYSFFLDHNSSDLLKNIFGELDSIIRGVIKPLMELLVEGILALTLIAFLVMVDPMIALFATLLLGGGYGTIYLFVRTVLNRASRTKVRWYARRYRTALDAFSAIKEVKLLGLEERYTQRYDGATYRTERARGTIQAVAKIPRYVLETLAFGGVLVLALVLFVQQGSASSVLPLMGAYVVAGYKLLPSLQRMFSAFAHIRGSHASVELIIEELHRSIPVVESKEPSEDISFSRGIVLTDLSFTYAGMVRPALSNISLTIEKNTTIGIAGPTGCGKTTLVDTILGLHSYQSGTLCADDMQITSENVRAWRKKFGYVPQSIYLSDTSVTRNIAFGVDDDQIDHERVQFVAQLANLHEFVEVMDQGYETQLGERGVRLSGGQRQRIGIARALYHDPDVLVFDEATSALDTRTEQVVMEAIKTLMHQKTLIIIAHRLSTLRDADKIFVLRDGEIDASGTFAELSASHPHFLQPEEPS